MTAAADFLPSILASPDDDTPRLVLADWLEENGDPERAEFIRIGCEAARLEALVERWIHTPHDRPGGSAEDGGKAGAAMADAQSLRRRERELLHYNEGRWLDWLKEAWGSEWVRVADCDLTWRRGFVDEVRCALRDWMRHGQDIVRAQPVRVLALAGGVYPGSSPAIDRHSADWLAWARSEATHAPQP